MTILGDGLMNHILVVEDNEISRKNLVDVLKENFSDIRIYQAGTGAEANKVLRNVQIDLFFLDIELPDTNGMKIAETIRSMKQYELAYIIFITTHLSFLPRAVQEYHCYDFIEKPFSRDKVINAADKLLRGITKVKVQEKKEPYIAIQLKGIIHKVFLKNIYFAESSRRKLNLHTDQGKIVVPTMTFKRVLELIEGTGVDYFVRTHRSYVVNTNHIKKIEKRKNLAWDIYFYGYDEIALVGDKYSTDVIKRIEGGK